MFSKNNKRFGFLRLESTSVVGAAVLVGFFSFVGDIVGLVRDRLLAHTFGAGDVLDVYYAASKVPDFLFKLMVIGALSASFIPLFTRFYHAEHDKEHAWRFTNIVLHFVATGMLIVALGLFVFAHPVAIAIAPGFSAAKQADVALFTRVMVFAQVVLAVSMVYGGVLQSLKRFFLYSLAPIFYNLGIVLGALLFVGWMGPIGLAAGVVFGACLHAIIQCIGLIGTGYRYRPLFAFRDQDALTVVRLMIPRVVGIGINQLLYLILTIVASTLAIGSVTIFQFAYNIEFFPIGVFGVSYAIAVFPTFAEHLAAKNIPAFRSVFAATVRQLLFFLVPATFAFVLLRMEFVQLVVGAHSFDENALILTGNTLAFFALSFIPQALIYILARAFFAIHDTVTPLVAGVVSAVSGIAFAYLFTHSFGVVGLAMAFGVSECLNAILLWVFLRRSVKSLSEREIWQGARQMIFAMIPAMFVMMGVHGLLPRGQGETFIAMLWRMFAVGVPGAGVYFGLLAWGHSDELMSFFDSIKSKLFKNKLNVKTE